MAKLIEFCGVPGVGKATVYNAVSRHWKRAYDWVPAEKIYPRKNLGHPLKRLARTLLLSGQSLLDEKAMRKAASRFIAHYPAYIDECWSHLEEREKVSLNQTDQRFEKAHHVFKLIQRIQISAESLATKLVLVEEGLVNGIGNALHKSLRSGNIEAEIQDIFDLMPLPAGLVFLEAESSLVVKRLTEREQFVPSLHNLRKDALLKVIEDLSTISRTAVKIYEKKGFPVLYLNGANPVKHNAEQTIKFLGAIPS